MTTNSRLRVLAEHGSLRAAAKMLAHRDEANQEGPADLLRLRLCG